MEPVMEPGVRFLLLYYDHSPVLCLSLSHNLVLHRNVKMIWKHVHMGGTWVEKRLPQLCFVLAVCKCTAPTKSKYIVLHVSEIRDVFNGQTYETK